MGELEYRVAWMPQIMSEAPDEQRVIFIIELLPVLLLLDLDVLCDVNHVEDQSSFVIPFDILAKGSEEYLGLRGVIWFIGDNAKVSGSELLAEAHLGKIL